MRKLWAFDSRVNPLLPGLVAYLPSNINASKHAYVQMTNNAFWKSLCNDNKIIKYDDIIATNTASSGQVLGFNGVDFTWQNSGL